MAERLAIEVGWVTAGGAEKVALEVPLGSTLLNALERARLDELAGIDWRACRWGIFGAERSGDTLLRDGDRVEVYSPLLDDPKAIRRRRAAAQRERRDGRR
ncbi:MAG: RnfH family protein [Gammaproteobacteria bacterium]|nr:RnfH family protein [Gammaproteobacteria bacterium]MCP5201652.1 RnfH family protein [Gammaproteobacteria bacterium]